MKSIGNQQSAIGNALKSAMPVKPPETAFWPRLIFPAPMAAKTGVRVFAMEKNQNAKGMCAADGCQVASVEWLDEKLLISALRSLTSGARLWFYGLALRYKRCSLTPDSCSLTPEYRANPAKGIGGCFGKPARMAV